MVKDYSKKLFNLKSRRQDVDILKKYFSTDYHKRINENYESLSESDSIKYAIGAMTPVDKTYTENTYKEGDRVKNQLKNNLSTSVEFEYQGSVTNNTHIKAHSDIDIGILTLYDGFVTLEPPLKAQNPYAGDSLQDLINLRE